MRQVFRNASCRRWFSSAPCRVENNGNVAVIRLNDLENPVNMGNAAFMQSLQQAVRTAQDDSSVTAIAILSDKPGMFVAGADIGMLQKCKTAEEASTLSKAGQEMLNEIASSKKPVVAGINGACMGLGTELALACHWRIATDSAKTIFALPEVQLGLLPGAGGTVRLPPLVGLPNALDMMLTGSNVRTAKAKKIGLVDEVVKGLGPGVASPEQNTMRLLEQVTVARARELGETTSSNILKTKSRALSLQDSFLTNTKLGRSIVFSKAQQKVEKQTHGNYPAPIAILKCVRDGLNNGVSSGLAHEVKSFGQLAATNVSKNLISIFFATQSLKKNRFGNPEKEVETIGVLGAGLMGAGIADVSLNKAKVEKVLLKDTKVEGLRRGEGQIISNLEQSVKKKQLSSVEKEMRLSHLSTGITYEGFQKANLVVEAVFEDIKVKHAVIQELEAVVPPDCVIASNTSALPISEIAKGSKRPENVVGMHYFSPVKKMPLLEVITHSKTSNSTAAAAVRMGVRQGKTVIVVKDGPGFYTTRILMPFVSEAFDLLRSGVSVESLDSTIRRFGFPVGPCTLTDEVGLDVGLHIAKYLGSVFPERLGGDISTLEEFVKSGYSGRKSGKGFFLYDSSEKKKQNFFSSLFAKSKKEVNPGAIKIIQKHELSVSAPVSSEDIVFRTVGRMCNEAVECLSEGVLNSATDGDIGAVFGLGFPAHLGGPFRYIDQIGAKTLVRHLQGFERQMGSQFRPAKMLVEYAEKDRKFHN